ncbi:D-alanyl-D-alanine carboxypeptidase family protein [Bacterioplanes sanyensis]|nr:D-alanyl-D-alanine carboxypeptidase family protein [Bacterioplanes sanyensis]
MASMIIPAPPKLAADAYILMDADTGQIIVEHEADKRRPPASLTKMMTSYIAVHELQLGNVSEDTMIPISVKAWQKGGSKMFVREGTEVPLIDLLRGIIVQSGNDASVAVAEYFSGSEEAYADWMNQYAKTFGMDNTHFLNATGWPVEGHYSTARDMAVLARHIIKDHPEFYSLYAEKYYEYNDIRQPNRNKLLWRRSSHFTVDGLKTGHTDEAGYCLAASAESEGTRFIAVVMGTRNDDARTRETQKLLAYGFRYYQTQQIHSAGDVLQTQPVWLGQSDTLDLVLENDLSLTLPRGGDDELVKVVNYNEYLEAPIEQGQVVGSLSITRDGDVVAERPLIAANAVAEAGFFGRLFGKIQLFFARLFATS